MTGVDLSQTIIPKADQLNADDLITGPLTIKITRVSASGSKEQPVSIHYEGGDGKPYKPCKSMRRVLIEAWGTDGAVYAGRRLTLYRDPRVRYGGIAVGGIRISHMSDISETLHTAITVTRGQRAPYTVKPLSKQNPKTETLPVNAPSSAGAPGPMQGDHGKGGAGAEAPTESNAQSGAHHAGAEQEGAPPSLGASSATFPGDEPPFVFSLVDSKGQTRTTTDGGKWADALCGMFAKTTNSEESQAVYSANSKHIKAAADAPDKTHFDRVEQAWKDAP